MINSGYNKAVALTLYPVKASFFPHSNKELRKSIGNKKSLYLSDKQIDNGIGFNQILSIPIPSNKQLLHFHNY